MQVQRIQSVKNCENIISHYSQTKMGNSNAKADYDEMLALNLNKHEYMLTMPKKATQFVPLENETQEDIEILHGYSSRNDVPINYYLRGTFDKNKKYSLTESEAKDAAEKMLEMFKRTQRVTTPFAVYKGQPICSFDPEMIGTRVQLKGFVSTSLNMNIALRYAEYQKSCLVIINIPIRSRVLYMGSNHLYPNIYPPIEKVYSNYPDEEEILLPHNSIFLVKNIQLHDTEKIHINLVELDLIDEPELLPSIEFDTESKKRKRDEDDEEDSKKIKIIKPISLNSVL